MAPPSLWWVMALTLVLNTVEANANNLGGHDINEGLSNEIFDASITANTARDANEEVSHEATNSDRMLLEISSADAGGMFEGPVSSPKDDGDNEGSMASAAEDEDELGDAQTESAATTQGKSYIQSKMNQLFLPKPVFVKYYTTTGKLSYAQSKAKCASHGHQLCSRSTLCPSGHAGNEQPVGGKVSGAWAAVSDSDNQWVSLGGTWPSCQLHSEIAKGKYGKPGWGKGSSYHAFRKKLPCCKAPSVAPSAAPSIAPSAAPSIAPSAAPSSAVCAEGTRRAGQPVRKDIEEKMDTCWSIYPPSGNSQDCSKKCDGNETKVISNKQGSHMISPVDPSSGCAYCPEGRVPQAYWHNTKVSLAHMKSLISARYVPSQEPLRSLNRKEIWVRCDLWPRGQRWVFGPDLSAYRNKECDGMKMKRGVNVMLRATGKARAMVSSPNLRNNYIIRCNVWKRVACRKVSKKKSQGGVVARCFSKKLATFQDVRCEGYDAFCGAGWPKKSYKTMTQLKQLRSPQASEVLNMHYEVGLCQSIVAIS